jgi:nucleotide-binding universal stress UspA family protein
MTNDSYFQKVLVPVDGSRPSFAAGEVAVDLAKKFDSKVTVIHVVPHEVRHPYALQGYKESRIPEPVEKELQGMFLQKGEQAIGDAKTLFKAESVPVDTILEEFADPAETILDVAQEKKSDLIIMGNRGSSEIEDSELGGVAQKVSRHAKCPVLVVKKRVPWTKILVAVDGSKDSKKALDCAVEISKKYGSEITILNVARMMIPQMGKDEAKMTAQRILSQAEARTNDVVVQKRIAFGHPAKEIAKVTKEGSFDLVALGSRGSSPAKRFVLGSVSENVARSVPCSVLIAR